MDCTNNQQIPIGHKQRRGTRLSRPNKQHQQNDLHPLVLGIDATSHDYYNCRVSRTGLGFLTRRNRRPRREPTTMADQILWSRNGHPREKVVPAVTRSRLLVVLFVLLVTRTETTVRDRGRRNKNCGNATADMRGRRFLPFCFQGFCVCLFLFGYSGTPGVVVVVVIVVVGIAVVAVVDIADAFKRLRHGLLLYPAYYYPDSTSVANNNTYIQQESVCINNLDLPRQERHRTHIIRSASASCL